MHCNYYLYRRKTMPIQFKLCWPRYLIFEMVLHKGCTRQLELWRWRRSHLAASQGEQAPFSGTLLRVFLATNALSDAVSTQPAGLQDTSPQLLLGDVTDTCGACQERRAGSRRGARTAGNAGFGSGSREPALLPGLELPVCLTGQVISSFASTNIIMTIASAAVNCRTNFSNPKPNTEGGWTPDRAELLQPLLAGCDAQFISFPRGVQANTLTPAMWGVSPQEYPLSEGVGRWSPALGCARLSAVHIRERCKVICSTHLHSTSVEAGSNISVSKSMTVTFPETGFPEECLQTGTWQWPGAAVGHSICFPHVWGKH
ncbi:uncharacterized protein LOC130250938 [Oenanthe melanoleuca]|uniref:uncharacterized protein LOC130250938 n=1 Tax=Oenanthe melanoleuca TaxID=2939378 RepID=UPI0024C1D592|nr:uncharacterized protein LOC130250938 [Oenanthe melanoleuca]